MKRIIRLLVIYLFAFISFPGYAKGIKSMNPFIEESTQIETACGDGYEPLDCREKEKKDSDKVKKSGKAKKTEKDKKRNKSSDPEKDLKEVIIDLKDSIAVKENQLKLQRIEIDSLKRDLDELLPFRLELLKNLCRNIKDLEELPFSSLSIERIDSMGKRIKPFLSNSSELMENNERLLRLKDRKQKYESFLSSIDTMPYGKDLITKFSQFKTEFSADTLQAPKKEIAELEKRMAVYPTLIQEFGKVIYEFQIQLEYARNFNDLSEAKDMTNVTFKMNDNFTPIKEDMSQVPYMESLLKEYIGLLLGNNPLDKRIIEIEGMVASMEEALPQADNK